MAVQVPTLLDSSAGRRVTQPAGQSRSGRPAVWPPLLVQARLQLLGIALAQESSRQRARTGRLLVTEPASLPLTEGKPSAVAAEVPRTIQ